MSQLFMTEAALAGAARSPDTTASEFYGWYLHALAADQDPLHDDSPRLSSYVSKELIREIERRINSADGLDEDYFVHAQDYLDDWPTHISTSKPKVRGGTAVVVVTLGASAESRRTLTLSLILEAGSWKIRKVQLS